MLMMSTPNIEEFEDNGSTASDCGNKTQQKLPPVNLPGDRSPVPSWASIKPRGVNEKVDNDRLIFGVSPRQTRYVKRDKSRMAPHEVISHEFLASMPQMKNP